MRGMTATLKKISEYIKSISPSNPQKGIDKVWLENHQTKITTQLIDKRSRHLQAFHRLLLLITVIISHNITAHQPSHHRPSSLITAYHRLSHPSPSPPPSLQTKKRRAPETCLRGSPVCERRRPPTLPHYIAVPSAQAGLTSLFGMGRGGTPPQ